MTTLVCLSQLSVPAVAAEAESFEQAIRLCNGDDAEDVFEGCGYILEHPNTQQNYLVALWERGKTYLDLGDYANAIVDLTAAIQTNSYRGVLFVAREHAYRETGQLTLATLDYNTAIELEQYLPSGYIGRARVHRMRGEHSRAISDYTEAIRLDPSSSFAYNERANVYRDQRKLSRAIADYTEAIKLDPEYPLPFVNRRTVHQQQGEFQRAIADVSIILELDPSSPDAYFDRGMLHIEMSEFSKADADFDQAELIDSISAHRLKRIAKALHSAGRSAEALDYVRKALDFNPTDPGGTEILATILNSVGRYDEAYTEYARTAELGGPEKIEELKTKLHSAGFYNGVIDGKFDEETRSALRSCVSARCFQEHHYPSRYQ